MAALFRASKPLLPIRHGAGTSRLCLQLHQQLPRGKAASQLGHQSSTWYACEGSILEHRGAFRIAHCSQLPADRELQRERHQQTQPRGELQAYVEQHWWPKGQHYRLPFTLHHMRHRQPCTSFSTMTAMESPPEAPIPEASVSLGLIPGRANLAGTTRYAQRLGSDAGPGHFRSFKVGGKVGELLVSSLGIGTWHGPETDAADKEYVDAIYQSLSMGINIIDTADSYRGTRSELAVGKALSNAIRDGIVNRDEVLVCSKAGFLAIDYREPMSASSWVCKKYIGPGIIKEEDFVGDQHCLSRHYLKHQVDVCRKNLGVDVIDIFYIHNPEAQLSVIPMERLMKRIRKAFRAMEHCVATGKISTYGISTWCGFRVNPVGKPHISLEEVVSLAKEVAGENHHFKVVQVPYNASLREVATTPTQMVNGKKVPFLHAAHQLGVQVITSCSLCMAYLCKNMPFEVRHKCPEIGDRRTNAQCALQFARTTPGVMTSLVGMRDMQHVKENNAIIKYPAIHRTQA